MKERKPTKLLQRIFELRKAKKINLTQMGKVMGGIKKSAASEVENGDAPLKAEYLPAIAKLLGVNTWELFTDEDKKEIGPLSDSEKALILQVRKLIPNETDRKALTELINRFSEG